MSLSQELQATERRRLGLIAQIALLTGRAKTAQRLFLGPDGNVSADAAAFFASIAQHAGMNRRGFEPDPRQRDYLDGGREIVRFIIDSLVLDAPRLRHLQQQLHAIEGKIRP